MNGIHQRLAYSTGKAYFKKANPRIVKASIRAILESGKALTAKEIHKSLIEDGFEGLTLPQVFAYLGELRREMPLAKAKARDFFPERWWEFTRYEHVYYVPSKIKSEDKPSRHSWQTP